MAVWSVLGQADVKAMSAACTLLVSAANAVAVLCFAVAGPVRWPETAVMLVAVAIGGYFGARLARRNAVLGGHEAADPVSAGRRRCCVAYYALDFMGSSDLIVERGDNRTCRGAQGQARSVVSGRRT